MSPPLTEDSLVQQTTGEYLDEALGWETVYAYNTETFGPEGTLGRLSDREVVLTRYLGEALNRLGRRPFPLTQDPLAVFFQGSLFKFLPYFKSK